MRIGRIDAVGQYQQNECYSIRDYEELTGTALSWPGNQHYDCPYEGRRTHPETPPQKLADILGIGAEDCQEAKQEKGQNIHSELHVWSFLFWSTSLCVLRGKVSRRTGEEPQCQKCHDSEAWPT